MDVNGVIVARHARARFGQRYSDLNMESVLSDATLRGPTIGGELWQSASFGVLVPFVLRRDPRFGPIVITFLPPDAAVMPAEEAAEVIEAYHRTIIENAPDSLFKENAAPLVTKTAKERAKAPATHAVSGSTIKSIAIAWAHEYGKRAKDSKIEEVSVGRGGVAKVPNTLAGWKRFAVKQAAAHALMEERSIRYKKALRALFIAVERGGSLDECRAIGVDAVTDIERFLAADPTPRSGS